MPEKTNFSIPTRGFLSQFLLLLFFFFAVGLWRRSFLLGLLQAPTAASSIQDTVSEALRHTNLASLSTFYWQNSLFYEYIYFFFIFNMVPTAFAVFQFVLSNFPTTRSAC